MKLLVIHPGSFAILFYQAHDFFNRGGYIGTKGKMLFDYKLNKVKKQMIELKREFINEQKSQCMAMYSSLLPVHHRMYFSAASRKTFYN